MTRTLEETRAIVERVVAEHGQGWHVSTGFDARLTVDIIGTPAYIVVDRMVWPSFWGVSGDTSCARAVALWPEMQRLVHMLREALK